MKHNKFLLAAGLVMALAALMVSPAFAGGPGGLTAHSVTITGINCATGQVNVSVAYSFSFNGGDHTVDFKNDSTSVTSIPHTSVPHWNSTPFSDTEALSANVGAISSGNTITVTSTFYNSSGFIGVSPVAIATTTANCDGIIDDGRINLQAWSKAIAYCSEEKGITIYQVNKESKVGLVMHITAAELAALPAKPASNLLIKTVGNVSLYKLTTGEYQMNVGPDSEGKTQVFTWRGCNRNTEYFHELQASIHAPYALMAGRRAS